MNQVAKWLTDLGPHHENIKSVTLTVGDEKFEGATYTFVGEHTADMDGVRQGKFEAGSKYYCERAYFIGKFPKPIKKRRKTVFIIDGKTYYVASYYQEPKENPHAPFGLCFMLGIWDEPHVGPIDIPGEKPYTRVPATLTPAE
jgi:hypothetical protein